MLDFYLLADDQNIANYPEEAMAKIVGSIDFETFERLKAKRIIPERFDYHSDFRWETALVQQIWGSIQKSRLSDSDAQSLLQLISIAKERGSGLIAYAD